MKPKPVTQPAEPSAEGRWIIAKSGNVEIPAYRLKDGRVCISYYEAGGRKRRTFVDEAEAKREAALVASKIRSGQHEVLELTNADRESYLSAKRHLEPLGTPLHLAVEDYAKTMALLPAGVSLRNAVESYLSRNAETLTKKSVAEVADEFLLVKKQDAKSARYLETLKSYLTKIKTAFQSPINDVTANAVEAWLRGLDVSQRTRENLRSATLTLFNYAKRKGYLPRDRQSEVEHVERFKSKGGDITIFTVEELGKLLAHADDKSLPFLALSAFAGLRHAEILRLAWEDIKWSQGHIEVGAKKAKTASRRLVPLLPALSAWLAGFRAAMGPIHPSRLREDIARVAKDAKVPWKKNALRHSFISYRIADVQNVQQVALEAGNSPQVIFSNYRELVTRKEAKSYFALRPAARSSKVVSFKKAA